MPPDQAPQWLTIRQAADRCGVTPQTIRSWIRSGDLKATRFGPRLVRIDAGDLDAAGSPYTPAVAP